MIDKTKPDNTKVFLTPRQLPEKYPAFTESSIRYFIFNAKTNGFDKCIKRIGRKILISESCFFDWIEAHN